MLPRWWLNLVTSVEWLADPQGGGLCHAEKHTSLHSLDTPRQTSLPSCLEVLPNTWPASGGEVRMTEGGKLLPSLPC